MEKVYTFFETKAVSFLSKRKAKKDKIKNTPKTVKGEILSWVDALVFAVIGVLILNQFLFQLFVIPSPSMVDTLNVGDRVVVSKMKYGTEVYPAGPKIFEEYKRVNRDDVITFYNPLYESKGPVFDVLAQILYMGTFSLINIDKNADGTVAERLYVKRAVGMPGDIINFNNGDVTITPAGFNSGIDEMLFRLENDLSMQPNRSVDLNNYSALHAWARLFSFQENDINHTVPAYLQAQYTSNYSALGNYPFDFYEFSKQQLIQDSLIDPTNISTRSSLARYENGIYVPENFVLPLGDNRDNSQDGRYFGPVSENTVNGKVIGLFWPLNKFGGLKD